MVEIGFFSLIVTVLLIRFGSPIARRLGLVDDPSRFSLKIHQEPVPVIGGIAIFVALVASLMVLGAPASSKGVVLSLLPLLLLGLVDDIWRLRPTTRLIIQCAVVAQLIVSHDLMLVNLGNLFGQGPVVLNFWAVPFTVFALVGLINAFNMIDGLDGLAGGTAAIALALLLLFALVSGLNAPGLKIIVATLGALAGFLYFNLRHRWNPAARVFLGDAGSLMLGLILGAVLFKITQANSPLAMPPVLALWILLVPLFDACSVTLRRIYLRKNPFRGDNQHIHHLLLKAGFSHSQTVNLLLASGLLAGLLAMALWAIGVPEWAMLAVYLVAAAAFLIWVVNPERATQNLAAFRLFALNQAILVDESRL